MKRALILLALLLVMGIASAEFVLDFGETEVGLDWKTVVLNQSFSSPIVVAKPIESCAGNAAGMCDMVVVRVKNVTSNSFDVKLQKWGKLETGGLLSPYKVQYLVLEEGHYNNVGGFKIEAGKFNSDHTGNKVAFMKNFPDTPVLVTSMATVRGEEPAVTRNYNPCKPGIQYYPLTWVAWCGEDDFISKVQEEEQRWGQWGHKYEEIHYIAMSSGTGTINEYKVVVSTISSVTDSASSAIFPQGGFRSEPTVVADMQSTKGGDSAIIRYSNKAATSINFFIAEEDSANDELNHAAEKVGYIAIGVPPIGAVNAVIEVDKDTCDAAPCTINFSGMSSSSNVGPIASYEWDFGDDKTGTGGTISHEYTERRSYTAKLKVTDSEGKEGTATKTIFVGVAPEVVAAFTATPESCDAPCEVQFDASESSGPIVAYDWDFGDGSPVHTGPDLVSVSHTYESGGEFTAKLTVKDASGNEDTAQKTISVAGVPELVAIIDTDKEGCAYPPCTVQFDASRSTGSIVSYEWDFGDDSTGTGVQVEHAFNGYGEFTVTLTVTDSSNNTASATVVIFVGCRSNDDCLCGDGCFEGRCLHPLLSINKSEDQVVWFKGEAKDIVTIWTLTNVGDHRAVVQDFWTPGCNGYDCVIELTEHGGGTVAPNTGDIPVIPCEGGTQTLGPGEPPEEPPTGPEGHIVINPGASVKVVERMKGVMPPSAKKELELGLAVQYTDEAGAGLKVSESGQKARVVLANLDLDKFHVKLKLKEQTQCIGWNDVYGVTGEPVAPRVLFDWSFNAADNETVSIDQCDRIPGEEFVYCDAVQFSISLLKKLHRIDELAGGEGTDALTEFKSFLIADNFSEDFRKDFDYYYKNSFLAAPSWYKDLPKPWHLYFSDFARLIFEPSQISESGLYNVKLEFVFEGDEYEFFKEGNPKANITVKFEKLHGVGVEVIDSPFYHLPFDGLVGTLREDDDGKTERKDYGLGFVNQGDALKISYVNTNLIATTPTTAGAAYLTSLATAFGELNLSERGEVFVVDLGAGEMVFSPSYAMPVILGIESVSDQAQAFYVPYKGDAILEVALDYATYWTGIAASPFLECMDFMWNALPYNQGDSRASSLENSCSVEEGREKAFGFKWNEVLKNSEWVFLKTIFYSAFSDPSNALIIANACTDPENSISIFASPFDFSSSPTQLLQMYETDTSIETFKDLVGKIANEEVCMNADDSKYTFFWNPEKIEEKLESAKSMFEERWSFNWESWQCNPFE